MDVCGPMPTSSLGGSEYEATFKDDYSGLSVVMPARYKSDVPGIVKEVLNRLEKQRGLSVKVVRSDRGGEYVNKELFFSRGKPYRDEGSKSTKSQALRPDKGPATQAGNGKPPPSAGENPTQTGQDGTGRDTTKRERRRPSWRDTRQGRKEVSPLTRNHRKTT